MLSLNDLRQSEKLRIIDLVEEVDIDITPLKSTLVNHLAVNEQALNQTIFPDCAAIKSYSYLFRPV